jgi:hypothetical protein
MEMKFKSIDLGLGKDYPISECFSLLGILVDPEQEISLPFTFEEIALFKAMQEDQDPFKSPIELTTSPPWGTLLYWQIIGWYEAGERLELGNLTRLGRQVYEANQGSDSKSL